MSTVLIPSNLSDHTFHDDFHRYHEVDCEYLPLNILLYEKTHLLFYCDLKSPRQRKRIFSALTESLIS